MEENHTNSQASLPVDIKDETVLYKKIKVEVTDEETGGKAEKVREIDHKIVPEMKKEETEDISNPVGTFESVYIKQEVEEPEEIPEDPSYEVYSIDCNPEDVKIETAEDAESYGDDIKTEMTLNYRNVNEIDQSVEDSCRTDENNSENCTLKMACLEVFPTNHSSEQEVMCYYCNFKANTISTLKKHIVIHVDRLKLKGVNNNGNLKVQGLTTFKTETAERSIYYCSVCAYKTWSKYYLNKHVKKKHLKYNLYYVCNECCYCATSKSQLIIHIKKHNEIIKCRICNFRTNDKGALTRHMNRHGKEIPHECHLCDYTTYCTQHLITHLNKHRAGKVSIYRCNICHFKTLSKARLSNHIRRHTGVKPYYCYICNYRASQKEYITRHVRRVHIKEKLLTCNICLNYKTSNQARLDRHICTHTGEMPFCCHYCPYKSKRKAYFEKHMIKHIDIIPNKCPCGAKIPSEDESVCEQLIQMKSQKLNLSTLSPDYLKNRIKSVLNIILEKGKIQRQCVTNKLATNLNPLK